MSQYVALKNWAETSAPYPQPFGYLDSLGAVPLGDDEILLTSHYYPIVVRFDDDRMRVLALTDSRFLTRPLLAPDGRWLGAYVPAALRCFPFRLAAEPSSDPLESLEIARLKPARPNDRRMTLVDQVGQPTADVVAVHGALSRVREGQERMTVLADQLLIAQLFVPLSNTTTASRADQFFTIDGPSFRKSSNRGLEAMARHSFSMLELIGTMLFSQNHLAAGLRPQTEKPADPTPAQTENDQQFAHLFNATAPWLDTSPLYSNDWERQ